MKKINIKESLLQIDKLTDCKYDLTSLYESCRLDEKKKEQLVKYIDAYDHEGMSRFLQNEVGGCMTENCGDDLTDKELQEELGEGFVHMTDETTYNPLVTGETLKIGDMVYDEETGHKLKVLTIASNSKYSREIGFGDTVNQRTFSQYVGNNSLWELAVEGDTAYETADDIEFEFHPREDLTADLNKIDEGLWDDVKKVGKAVGSAIKNDTPIGRGLTQVARGIKNDLKTAAKATGLDKVGKAAKDAFKDTDLYKGYQADKGASVAAQTITKQKDKMRHPDNLSKYIVRMKDKYPMLDYTSSNSRITQEIKKVCNEKGWDFEQVLKKAGLKLREALNESVDKTSLEAEIRSTVAALLDDDYMPVVEVSEEDGYIKVEVRAEVDYDMLTELSNKLDVIVQKYDPSAYFEPVTAGIINAFVEKEPRSNEVDFDAADYWGQRFSDCINLEELRALYREYMKAREDMTMATTDVIWEVVKDMMQKLDEEYAPMVEAMMNLYEEVSSTFKSLVDDSDLQILETDIVPGTNSFKAEYISGDSEGRVYNFIEADKAGYDYVVSKGCDPDDLPTEVFKGEEVREGAYFITENDFEEFPKPNPVNEGLLDQIGEESFIFDPDEWNGGWENLDDNFGEEELTFTPERNDRDGRVNVTIRGPWRAINDFCSKYSDMFPHLYESATDKPLSWHDVYKKFLDVVDSKYNGTNADELNNEIESLYASHKGEPAWDGAYRRWHEYDDEYDAEGNNIHEDVEDKWPWLKVYPQLEKAAQSVYISYNWNPDTSLEDTAKMDAEAAKVVKALVDEHKGEADWEEAYRRLLDTAPELELKESVEDDFEEDNYNKQEVVSWLEDHSTAYEDITDFFGSVDLSEIDLESILGWIEDHDELYDDFLRFFEMDDESLTEATPAGYEGIPLQSLADAFKVEGPSHRGAPAPEFNPLAFNEANIPDNMRYKTFTADLAKDTIMVSWVTQEEFSSEDAKVFEEELIRFFKAIADHIGYKASFKVEYDVRCRESDDSFALNTVTINADQLTEAWTDCYKEFEKIVNDNFPNEEAIESAVYELAMSHWPDPDWQKAYEKWLEGSPDEEEMEEALRTEDDWEYCPSCSERALKGTGDSTAVCDKCGAEFSIVHMPNNKLKILPSNESLTEADYEKFEIIPDNRPSKRYIGGKEVPYKDWDDAKAHFKDDYHITDYADELRQFIKSEGAHFTVEETTDGRLAIEIDNGDWKHDHIYVDSLVQTFFNNKGLWVSVEQDTTEEAEDDCYSATHYYDLDSFTLEERPIEESLNESDIEKYIITAKEGNTPLYYNDSDDSFNTDINLATQYSEKEVAQDDYNMVKERYPSATIQSIYNLPLLNKEGMNEDLTIPTKAIVNAQSLETSKERREALADILYKASKGDSFTYGGVVFNKTEDAPGAIWKVTGGNGTQNGFMDAYFGDDLVKTLSNKQYIGCCNSEDLEESAYDINKYRNEEGKLCADKWYASQYPDDEVGIEQLNGYFMDDILKDRSKIDHCDTQVRDRVYAQLDKYIPLSVDSPMYKEVNEDINDSDEVLIFKRNINLASDADEIQQLIYELSDGVAEDNAQQAFNENESNDLETLKSAVVTAIDVYLEDNEWLGESINNDLEADLKNSTKNFSNRQGTVKYTSKEDMEAAMAILKKHYEHVKELEDKEFYCVNYKGLLNETLEPESEDIPWDYETMEKELKIATNNFTAKGDRFNLGFQKEVDDAIDILKRYYRNVEAKPQDSTWTTIIYHDPIGEE
jgi:hypothetical protein